MHNNIHSSGRLGKNPRAVKPGVGVGVGGRRGALVIGLEVGEGEGEGVGVEVGIGQNGGCGILEQKSRKDAVGVRDPIKLVRGATMVGLGVGLGVGVTLPWISPDINGKGLSVQSGGIGPLSGHFGGVGGNGFIVQSGGIGPVSGHSRAIILLPPPLRILS